MLRLLKMDLIAACVALTGLFTLPHQLTPVAPTAAPAPVVSLPTPPVTQAQAPAARKPHRPLSIITGVASWYGTFFNGRKTASGETFAQEAMTACHRTLPFGTKVKVTDISSGKSVIVRINDRGVLTPSRVIDLSHGAARELGILNAGVARVRLEVLDSVTPIRPL